ncbi:hypothetical protein Q3G72_009342 [Acer saccharum]|nr:hypothetical protein Q3G72_009342 [Acer saccharum]
MFFEEESEGIDVSVKEKEDNGVANMFNEAIVDEQMTKWIVEMAIIYNVKEDYVLDNVFALDDDSKSDDDYNLANMFTKEEFEMMIVEGILHMRRIREEDEDGEAEEALRCSRGLSS